MTLGCWGRRLSASQRLILGGGPDCPLIGRTSIRPGTVIRDIYVIQNFNPTM